MPHCFQNVIAVGLLSAMLAVSNVVGMQAVAGEADVVDARAEQAVDGTWRFSVTVRHADTGWDHYADLWEVRTLDGDVLAQRVLAHPHVDEQPFTRSLSGVDVPDAINTVVMFARDSVHGFGGASVELKLR